MLIIYLWQEERQEIDADWKTITINNWDVFQVSDTRGKELVGSYSSLFRTPTSSEVNWAKEWVEYAITSFSYTTAQDYGDWIKYITWTWQINSVVVNINAIVKNWEFLQTFIWNQNYNRESFVQHSTWLERGILWGSFDGWIGTVLLTGSFDPPAIVSQTFTFSWPSEVNKDANWVYTLFFGNDWPDTSKDTLITLPLPAWVNYVTDNWGWVESGWTVTWDLWDYNAGQSITINLELEFTQFWNKSLIATLTDDVWTSVDIVRTVNTNVLFADIELWISWTNDSVFAVPFTQTISVTNNWPTQANWVVVEIVLPAGIDWVSWSGWSYNAWTRTATRTIWTMANGAVNNSNISLAWNVLWVQNIEWDVSATTPDWIPLNNEITRPIEITTVNITTSILFNFDPVDSIYLVRRQFPFNLSNLSWGYATWDLQIQIQFPMWTPTINWFENSLVTNFVYDAWNRVGTWDLTNDWLFHLSINSPMYLFDETIPAWDVVTTLVVNSPFNELTPLDNVFTYTVT